MRGLLVFTFVMTLGGTLAQGHHSIAAAYDRDRPVKLDGVLVQFAMVQPHPYVVVEIKDGRDTARWRHPAASRLVHDEELLPGSRELDGQALRALQHASPVDGHVDALESRRALG